MINISTASSTENLATAAAVADLNKNLEAREAGLLYSHSSIAIFCVSR